MDLHLSQSVQARPHVRAWDIDATDPYVEICWGKVAKPRPARLVSCVAQMTEPGVDRVVTSVELWEALRERPAPVEISEKLLVDATLDAVNSGLASGGRGVSPDDWHIDVYDRVPLVEWWSLDHLDDGELACHIATLRAVHERVGPGTKYAVGLPDWVYWHAGFESTDVDLASLQYALYERWSATILGPRAITDQAHARALAWLGGPDHTADAPLEEPSRTERDIETPAPERDPATESAQRRLERLSRGDTPSLGLGL